MSEITKEQLIEHIANMTVLELSELVKELEEKFGVTAAAAVAAAPAAAANRVRRGCARAADVQAAGRNRAVHRMSLNGETLRGLRPPFLSDIFEGKCLHCDAQLFSSYRCLSLQR